jgi:hypothetical protein
MLVEVRGPEPNNYPSIIYTPGPSMALAALIIASLITPTLASLIIPASAPLIISTSASLAALIIVTLIDLETLI